ncbi:alpha/beta-hydrolase [Aspergillus japonicus CBS 114.51]|uniref:Alpha/beta-hydrolase n=1 Tax=Aspergillus japonicus CBS 114.51 TaxID=1448312 RepID=A0A8T8X7V6_ASPJA|nr:alpha/beta-hydrolase [Aspergillus japonicus CBS 114.51]RAH84247.1 alpha/beta-hydrolase [Aspergillus japonicus CBS 114.51]
MPPPVQLATMKIRPPTVGHNGYQGFHPRTEILPKGWNGFSARALSEDLVVQHDVGIRVRDGCTLYCDIYRPVRDAGDQVPAIVAWSPFGKKHNGISMMQKVRWGCGVPAGCLSGLERFEGPDPAEYCPRGFAVVNVDSRGAGDSEGSMVIMGAQEGEDGHDVIEALAKMPWCNGRVGLAGNSHLGIVQWFIAATRPPSLKAIAPWEACADLYREQFVRGGAWDNGLFDLITRESIRGHHGLEDFREMYRRSPTMNPYWADKRAEISKIRIPTYVVASYSSFVHTMGSVRGWTEVDSPHKWLRWDPYQEWYDLWAVQESRDELAAFFTRYLKDEENGWEETPRVRMSALRFGNKEPVYPIVEEDFPLPRTEYKELFLGSGGRLAISPTQEESVVVYNAEKSGAGPVDYVGFVHTFAEKTRLMGLPKAVLYMSCDDLDDMVVYVLIRKLDKHGREMINVNIPLSAAPYPTVEAIPRDEYSNLTIYYGPTGVLRASHRAIDRTRSLHPQYPFHPHSEVDKITPGTVVELEIGLWAMGVDYEAGESLRVQVSGENPLIQEGKYAKAEVEVRNRGQHQVHFGGRYPSRVILPFV